MERVYVGDDRDLDPCGLILPVAFAAVDRIDSTQAYAVDNMRVLSDPLNSLKSNSANDLPLALYINFIKQQGATFRVCMRVVATPCADLAQPAPRNHRPIT